MCHVYYYPWGNRFYKVPRIYLPLDQAADMSWAVSSMLLLLVAGQTALELMRGPVVTGALLLRTRN